MWRTSINCVKMPFWHINTVKNLIKYQFRRYAKMEYIPFWHIFKDLLLGNGFYEISVTDSDDKR